MYTPNISKGSINNFQMQQVATSPFDTLPSSQQSIPGTEITYTCPSNASKVIYEIKAQWYVGASDTTHSYFFLQLYEKIGSGNYTDMGVGYRWTEIFQFLAGQSIMDCKIILPAYTGERSYELRVRSHPTISGRDVTFHRDRKSVV